MNRHYAIWAQSFATAIAFGSWVGSAMAGIFMFGLLNVVWAMIYLNLPDRGIDLK